MKTLFIRMSFVLGFLLCSVIVSNAQITNFPFPEEGSVSDGEGLFTVEQQDELNELIKDFQVKTKNEIAIVTVKSVAPYNNMVEYSTDLSNNWHLYSYDSENSLIIIVSKTLGTVRITTAYGTEKLLRNDICKKIIDSQMIPAYADGNWFVGTKQGLVSLMKEWN